MNGLGRAVILAGRRLVEDQRRRPQGQGDGQGEPLLLAERQGERGAIEDVLDRVERRPTQARRLIRSSNVEASRPRFVGPNTSSSRTVLANSIWLGLWKT